MLSSTLPRTYYSQNILCQLRHSSSSTGLAKPKIVVVGSGWAGFRIAKDLDKSKYDVTVLSPRNHFLFTPLLPSTTVGTLEFRCAQEPVRTIKDIDYIQAAANSIDFDKKKVKCTSLYKQFVVTQYKTNNPIRNQREEFDIEYDKIILAMGIKSNTFGVPGFESREEDLSQSQATGTNKHNVFFLKQLNNARAIRNRIIECFERASSPFISEEEKRRLLTFLVVGGGPTSIEFTSELYDFLHKDVTRWYPDLASSYNVVLIEAGKHLLGAFHETLSSYVERLFKRRQISLMTGETVAKMNYNSVTTGSGKELGFGVCVWSTGNCALDMVRSLGLPLSSDGRILVDDRLKVVGQEDVFALGDCAVSQSRPLEMLAQVANQQGRYLARTLNQGEIESASPFRYKFMGSMTQLGTWNAVADLNGTKLAGLSAFLVWRSAYWGKQAWLCSSFISYKKESFF